ncbi:MAG: DUF4474 domain-containing protein [Oscillospiraceae bacterium]|nr:DUF4474 domain-containing protein [Oscillospiraceae bacterium]
MKSKLIKITSLLIALTVLLCCLTACGQKKPEEEEITKKPVDIEAPPTENLVDFDEYTLPEDEPSTDPEEEPSSSAESSTGTTAPAPSTTKAPNNGTNPTTSAPTTTQGYRTPTTSEMKSLLKAAGYIYDEEQDIYYTDKYSWQRHFGFSGIYDEGASYLNMEYVTFKCDFTYNGKYWRIQCWKGQYALLCGAEMGVYTKDIDSSLSEDFYACANDDNLLEMGFDFYKTTKDYNNRNRLFYRPLEFHWWQTGFKFGYCNPTNCVAVMTLRAKDTAMADGIEKGLQNVTNKNGRLNPFYEYGTKASQGKANLYQRSGNEFKIIWVNAGYTNYSGNMA